MFCGISEIRTKLDCWNCSGISRDISQPGTSGSSGTGIPWKRKVKQLRSKDKCFENTYEKSEAKRYVSMSVANGVLTKLASYGEDENNNFELIECN